MKSLAEAEPWDALDLDDSELPSFLHPRKRKYSPPPGLSANPRASVSTISINPPILRHCSLRSSQTLTPEFSSAPVSSPAETSGCLIPGPAGAVQTAMRRKVLEDPCSFAEQGDPIPTQEYIRRVVEEPGGVDEDFSRDPWLSAVDFIRREGLVGADGVAIGTPVSVIKSGFRSLGKVNQVVAIIKSCTPNGLGDLMLTLKDPTGAIDASVHSKVLAERLFGRDIRVGAVLILRKVAVFAPSRSSCYLNITPNNISKVITGGSLLSLRKNNSAASVKDSAPTFGIMNSLRQNVHTGLETHSGVEMGGENLTKGSNWIEDVTENQHELGEKSLLAKPDLNKKTEAAADRTDASTHQEHGNLEMESHEDVAMDFLVDEQVRPRKQFEGSHQLQGSSCDEDAANTKASRTQPLPQWTDEQLDELFAYD